MRVILDKRYQWRSRTLSALTIHDRGDGSAVDSIAQSLMTMAKPNINDAIAALHNADGHFAAIIDGRNYLLACVDHCRTIPVFFADQPKGDSPLVSNSARLVKATAGLEQVDEASALEASMAGFVTGRHTLYEGLEQLQAGDLLWHDKLSGETLVRQYYTYRPGTLNNASEADLIDQLGVVTDQAMDRVIAQANGAPICVPLSAGLDSRLILCKLVERGYDNLFAFSYGPAGNDEAKAARTITERLGVPWRFWPNRNGDMRRLYASTDRADYWAFGDGLCALPNFQDFPTLHEQCQRGELPDGAVIVNGQTGDFISGGHIPKPLWDNHAPTMDDLFEAVVAKHYSLWSSLKTSNSLATLRARMLDSLELTGDEQPGRDAIIALYERWEYQERQAKYIVNGQRNYDFLGLDWALPLWDRRLVDFWRDVPTEHKFRKRLYRRYLETWDYQGLFQDYKPVVWQWPGATKAVLPLFRLVRLVFGTAARDRLLKNLLYFGMYRYQYAPFGYRNFLRHARNLRNPISLLSRDWLAELGLAAGVR